VIHSEQAWVRALGQALAEPEQALVEREQVLEQVPVQVLVQEQGQIPEVVFAVNSAA
jgi:hypothetical protein